MARHRGRLSPVKTEDGRWLQRVHHPDDPSGNEPRQLGTFKLKGNSGHEPESIIADHRGFPPHPRCCALHARDAVCDAWEGPARSPDTATIRVFLPIWRDKYKRGAGSTNQGNRYRIEAVLDIEIGGRCLGDMPLSTIDSAVASDLRALMIEAKGKGGKGWSIGYATNLLSTLSAFFGDAAEHYGGGTNPFWRAANRLPAKQAKPRDERWRPWTLIQMRNIADAADDRYKTMMHTLATGGFRRGELLALKRVNVDWDGCKVYVEGTEFNGEWSPTNRYKNHDRWVLLPEDVMQMLANHPQYIGSPWLFYTPGEVRKPRIDWPSYAELVGEIESTSYTAVSRRLGISDNAVRNHVRRYAPDYVMQPAPRGGKMWRGDNFVRDVFNPTCDRAGVKASPQEFRKSLNQHMVAQGISDNDRTALLGHHVKVNRDHYTEIEIQDPSAIRRALA